MRRYLLIFACVTAGVMALLAGFNALVDPHAIMGTWAIEGFNAEKPRLDSFGGRAAKSVALAQGDWQGVVLGTSRVELGIDPDDPAFGGLRVYNAALKGTNFVETEAVAAFALGRNKLSLAVIGLDFLAFNAYRGVSGDYGESLFAGRSWGALALRDVLSETTFEHAIQTVTENFEGSHAPGRANGFHDKANELRAYTASRAFDATLRNNFLVNPETYGDFALDEGRIDAFRRTLSMIVKRGVRVALFIPPVHARMLEAKWQLGLFPDYEKWKRELTMIVAAMNRELPPEQKLVLWDFSSFGGVASEPVPTEPEARMQWFWDNSHSTRALGHLVLERILNGAAADGFGRVLEPTTIERTLAEIRAERAEYVARFPDDVAHIAALVAETKPVRDKLKAERLARTGEAAH